MEKVFHNKVFNIIEKILSTVFTIIIIAYLSFILLQRINGNRSVLGYRLFTVASGSMSGVYEINDVIAVKDWDVNDLKVGDDIAYQGKRGGLENKMITHRIIRIEDGDNGKIFVTKGVSSIVEDPPITGDQILGKVVGIVPVISTINHIVKSQLGFFLLIFCPLVLIIVLEILQTITDIRLEKNEIREISKNKDKEEVKEEKDKEKEEKSKNDDADEPIMIQEDVEPVNIQEKEKEKNSDKKEEDKADDIEIL